MLENAHTFKSEYPQLGVYIDLGFTLKTESEKNRTMTLKKEVVIEAGIISF